MYQAIATFLLCVALTGVAASRVLAVRLELLKPVTWIVILAAAAVASAASNIISTTRHAGTGFTTSHGWPKPFFFRYLSATGEESYGWDAIYFVGNALAFAGPLLVLWTVYRLIRR
jgi:hypothetical protein